MSGTSRLRRMTRMLSVIAAAGLIAGTAGAAHGQDRVTADDEWCEGHDQRDGESVCEVREWTISPERDLAVTAKPNGGIKLTSWDRNEIQVRAKVHGWADESGRARSIVDEIDVSVGGKVGAKGPKTKKDEGWSVSYRITVPRSTNLDLESTNGGITIEGVEGKLRFHTTNGGVHLDDVNGDVAGKTTNGGLHVTLAGSGWTGKGLDVQTTNGGVTLSMPSGYSAHLEASTTNGGFHIGFPVTVQGRIDRKLSTDIGGGGPTIRVKTTNGGVRIDES